MIEVNLREISFGVMPMSGEGGLTGKRIHFKHEDSNTVYYVPLSGEAAEILAEHLTMDNDALEAKLQQDQLDAEAADSGK